jgi:hypothetical protein
MTHLAIALIIVVALRVEGVIVWCLPTLLFSSTSFLMWNLMLVVFSADIGIIIRLQHLSPPKAPPLPATRYAGPVEVVLVS